jgi:quinol-cytochrome oxidoreductase complex cytochrome b subunit
MIYILFNPLIVRRSNTLRAVGNAGLFLFAPRLHFLLNFSRLVPINFDDRNEKSFPLYATLIIVTTTTTTVVFVIVVVVAVVVVVLTDSSDFASGTAILFFFTAFATIIITFAVVTIVGSRTKMFFLIKKNLSVG